MGKVMWIAVMAAVAWASLELMNEGVDGAFGGILGASDAAVEHVEQRRTAPQRAGDKAQAAVDMRESRLNALLPE